MRTTRSIPAGILGSLLLLAACGEEPMAPEIQGDVQFELPAPSLAASDGGEVNTDISVTTPILQCGGTGTVTVNIQGITPPPDEAPVEIMLVLDESGSISPSEFLQVRDASRAFLEVIDQADGTNDNLLDAARIGVVKFAISSILRQALTSSYPAINAAVSTRNLSGGTNIGAGLNQARLHLNAASRPGAAEAVILFSDGFTQNVPGAISQANALKAQGVRIFTIGIAGADQNLMRQLASSPADFVFVNNFAALTAAFESIAGQVTYPAGTDVTFSADVPSGFTYVPGSASASKGTVSESGGTVTWTIARLDAETATMTYEVQHDQATEPAGGVLTAVTNASTEFTTPKSLTPVVDPQGDVDTEVQGCDTTPPEVSYVLDGTLGDNDWFVSDVDLTWTVVDNESAITSLVGCVDQNVTTDGDAYSFSCQATSAGGTSDEVIAAFKRDATVPTVGWTGNAGAYDIADDVLIDCSSDDNLSGVASDTCVDLAGQGWEFLLGTNSYSATATDNAGNLGEGSTSFDVSASFDGLCALVEQFVSHAGVANSLCAKVAAASRAADRGNTNAQSGALGAFIAEVEAQTGKKVPAAEADVLIALAQALMP